MGPRRLTALTFALLVGVVSGCGEANFAEIESVEARKRAFVSTLCPLIERFNAHEEEVRANIAEASPRLLTAYAARYSLSDDVEAAVLRERLLRRAGPIPAELVLAQAALESGWGTSELAQEGNNLFGRRCFYVDECVQIGKVSYRRFDSFEPALALYFDDLNSLLPYKPFRDLRALHGNDADAVVAGLTSYSTKGAGYVRQLRQMMADPALSCAA